MDEIDKLHLRFQGVKQNEVARLAGMSVSGLSNILNRKTDPRLSTITKLNTALDELGARKIEG